MRRLRTVLIFGPSPKGQAIAGGVIYLLGLVGFLFAARLISDEVALLASSLVLMGSGLWMWREGVKRDDREQMEALLAERCGSSRDKGALMSYVVREQTLEELGLRARFGTMSLDKCCLCPQSSEWTESWAVTRESKGNGFSYTLCPDCGAANADMPEAAWELAHDRVNSEMEPDGRGWPKCS